jgi:hypothetical protein
MMKKVYLRLKTRIVKLKRLPELLLSSSGLFSLWRTSKGRGKIVMEVVRRSFSREKMRILIQDPNASFPKHSDINE